jgi:hypothetical protein
MPKYFMGALGTVEQAGKFGHEAELREIHERIDEWILGYMKAAYDARSHTLRSIIIDGTDVTDHVFLPGKVLHGWGAKEGDSFIAHTPAASFHAALARAYRLAGADVRPRYWKILRELFRGAGLGDLGASPEAGGTLNLEAKSSDPRLILALADIYRVHRQDEVLAMMEHLGRNVIRDRQDTASGLFALPPEHVHTKRHNKRTLEPWEERTVGQLLRGEFDYARPKVVALDVVEPLALLAIHACRSGQFEKVPQWLNGGQWGTDGSGHVIDVNLERWFDRERMKRYYRGQQARLEELGYEVGEGWFAGE